MKVTVKRVFVDKFNTSKQYKVGEEIEITDQSRLDDLITRGLVRVAEDKTVADKPKKPATKKGK